MHGEDNVTIRHVTSINQHIVVGGSTTKTDEFTFDDTSPRRGVDENKNRRGKCKKTERDNA